MRLSGNTTHEENLDPASDLGPDGIELSSGGTPAGQTEEKPSAQETSSRPAISWRRRLAAAACVVLLLLAGFGAGYAFRSWGTVNRLLHPASVEVDGDSASSRELARRLTEVNDDLAENAYDPPGLDDATSASIKALITATGDTHAQYLTADEYAAYQRASSGGYHGIGIEIGDLQGSAVVTQVYPGSPAEGAGMRQGDLLLGVDDDIRESWDATTFSNAVTDAAGDDVTITWRRADSDGGSGEVMSATMTRADVKIPNVEHHLDGDVGYIRLSRFTKSSADDMSFALDDLESQGADGYVVDLRNDTGGFLVQATQIVSLFLESGCVVQVDSRSSGVTYQQASGSARTDKPLVILVNGYSASASEIMASSLQENGRAELVGTRTYGKGTVQTIDELSFGGAIRYTIAHYLTASGNDIDGVGIEPDVVVDMDASAIGTDQDTQYSTALERCRELVEQSKTS